MGRAYPGWAELIVVGLGSGEGLVAYLKKREKQGEPRALVMESEFGRLLTVMTREGSTLSPMVRDAWDGVPMGRVLARDQDIVPLHHVGVIAHVTPVELRQRLTSTDSANGFGNRFLWLAVRRTRLVPFPASPAERVPAAAIAAIGAAIEEAQSPAEVTWSAAARDAWEDPYLQLTLEPRVGLYGSLVARAEAQVVRLALVYALLDRSPVVDTAYLAAATSLSRYAERSAAHGFGRSTGNRHADALLRILRDGPLGREAAKRELGIRTAADLQDAIDLLRQIGAVETVRVTRAGGGRPAEVLRLAGVTTHATQTTPMPAPERGPEVA